MLDVERDFPGLASPISVTVDGVWVANTTANASRPDLVPARAPEPRHGIDVTLPAAVAARLHAVGAHRVGVLVHREAELDWVLPGTPLCIGGGRRTCHPMAWDCACNSTQ